MSFTSLPKVIPCLPLPKNTILLLLNLKKTNNLTSDVIKIGQKLRLPPLTIKLPFVIAKSINNLSKEDSKSSKLEKLPAKFYTRNDELYKAGKEAIHKKLISLMEWGSAQLPNQPDYEIFTKDLANKFLTNTNS